MTSMNFYFLSTGRCGTRFFSSVLNTATNASVKWQPKFQFIREEGRKVVSKYSKNKKLFKQLTVNDSPPLKSQIDKYTLLRTEIYGSTFNQMYPFGYMIYKYLGKRVRLVHLIRHPVPCCRSLLKSERDDSGHGRFAYLRSPDFIKGDSPAEKAANIWIGINSMIKYQFDLIGNPNLCRVFRLEDLSIHSLSDLFDFLQLKGFSKKKVSRLMNNTSYEVRNSHLDKNPMRPDATLEELEKILEMCMPLAKEFGYEEGKEK